MAARALAMPSSAASAERAAWSSSESTLWSEAGMIAILVMWPEKQAGLAGEPRSRGPSKVEGEAMRLRRNRPLSIRAPVAYVLVVWFRALGPPTPEPRFRLPVFQAMACEDGESK